MEHRNYLIGQCFVLSVFVFIASFTYLEQSSPVRSSALNYGAEITHHSQSKISREPFVLPDSTVVGEAIMNDPQYVFGVFDLAVSGELSSYNLGILLRKQYYTVIKRPEFKESGLPMKIEINAYDAFESSRTEWLAKLTMTSSMEDPIVKVNVHKLASIKSRLADDALIVRMTKEKWDVVETVEHSRNAKSLHVIVNYGDVPWRKNVHQALNAQSGELIEMIYTRFAHIDTVTIEGYGYAPDKKGVPQKVTIYTLKTDRATTRTIDFSVVPYAEAIEGVFAPWIHSQLKEK
jgi:hypothetical protein